MPERYPCQPSSNTFPRSERVKTKPRSIHTFRPKKPQDSRCETAGNSGQNMPMFRGSRIGRSLLGKSIRPRSAPSPKRPQAAGAKRRSCRPRSAVPKGGRREAPRPPPGPGPATATCPRISPAAPTSNGPIAGRSQQRHRRRGPGLVFRTLRRPVRRLVRGSEGAGQGAAHGRGRSEN